MPRDSRLLRAVCVVFFAFCCVTAGFCQATYYVDANFGGSARNGSAANPWQSLSDSGAWTAINGSLASGAVTVYFSARNAASDTNEVTSTPLELNRTNTGSNLLSLIGGAGGGVTALYNSNTNATGVPVWTSYTGTSTFEISVTNSSAAVASQNQSCTTTQETDYITMHGFTIVGGSNGQPISLNRTNNYTLEYSTVTNNPGPTQGPGITIGCSNLGAGGPGGYAGTNITLQHNTIHDTFGEAIYITGWYGCNEFGDGQTNCPNGVSPSGSHSAGAGGACNAPGTWAGNNLLIQYNTVYNAGSLGGEKEEIDIKDCWTNITIQNNDFYQTSPSGTGSNTGANSCVQTNSAALVQNNFCHDVEQVGINPDNTYDEYSGYWSNMVIRNNIIVNTALSQNYNYGYGIGVTCTTCSANSGMISPVIENNSIYNVHKTNCSGCAVGIYIDPTYSGLAGFTVKNNIVADTDGLAFSSPAGTLTGHGNNLYYNSAGGNIVNYGGVSYTGTNITSFESTSVSGDPLFVNTAAPYSDADFKLQAGSPAIGVGATISPAFPDYFGNTRAVPWDIGAIAYSTSTVVVNPPSGLSASVN